MDGLDRARDELLVGIVEYLICLDVKCGPLTAKAMGCSLSAFKVEMAKADREAQVSRGSRCANCKVLGACLDWTQTGSGQKQECPPRVKKTP